MFSCRTPDSPLRTRCHSAKPGFLPRHLTALLSLALLFALALVSPSNAAKPSPQATPIQSYPERPTPSQPAVPGSPSRQRPAPEPPRTEQYTLSHDRYEKAVAYSRAEYLLYFVSYVLSVIVLLLLLRLGVAAKLRDFAESASGNRWLQGLVFVPMLIGILDLCDLPVHLYGHSLSLHYEQSVQGWGSWFWDWSKGELLGIAFAYVLVLILFAAMRWSPRRWWFFFWLATLPILLFVVFISPWFIDPMFNTFGPLETKYPELTAEMEKVIQRTGLNIPPDRMFLMEASKKTNDLNAYVTGLGASKRVVVWDTTIQKLTTDETLFIFGHEAGHYVLNHVRNGFLCRLSRPALGVGPLGAGLENLRVPGLGFARRPFFTPPGDRVFRHAHREWFQPRTRTCRRCLRPGSNSRNRSQCRGSGCPRLPGFRRSRPGRSQSSADHHLLALFSSAARRPPRFRL
jgi:Zn-dependent protease with chaperone function